MAGLAMLLLQDEAIGQTCTHFGDPIINITFGNEQSPMVRLPVGTTDYTWHDGNSFLSPNHYMITANAIAGAAGTEGAYHHLRDHTGDPGGRMLLVNASEVPGTFYTSVQTGLCPNTTFNFSAWIANVSPAVMSTCGSAFPVQVEFEIQTPGGETLAVFQTPTIPGADTARWEQYEVTFNTGQHADIRLIIRNIGPGGCGNNLALDDIQFRPCGPAIELASPSVRRGDTLYLCSVGDLLSLTGMLGDGFTTPAFQWQQSVDGDTWVDIPGAIDALFQYIPAANTWFRLAVAADADILSNQSCRVVSTPLRVAVAASVPPRLTANQVDVCAGRSISWPNQAIWVDGMQDVGRWYQRTASGEWQRLDGILADQFIPAVDQAGLFSYERRVSNACGDSIVADQYALQVHPFVPVTLQDLPRAVCQDGGPLSLHGHLPLSVRGSTDWGTFSGPGVADATFHPQLAGVGSHRIAYAPPSQGSCTLPMVITIQVHDAIYIHPMPDLHIARGETITLSPNTNATRYEWDAVPGLDHYDIAAPNASPLHTTSYRLTASSESGCTATAAVRVVIVPKLSIPNMFSPNGDGQNDTWQIKGAEDYPDLKITIFNRWGQQVQVLHPPIQSWDGTRQGVPLPVGAYYYSMESSFLKDPMRGSLTLLR